MDEMIADCGLRIADSAPGENELREAEASGKRSFIQSAIRNPQSAIRNRLSARNRGADLGLTRFSIGAVALAPCEPRLALDRAGSGLRRNELRLRGRALATVAQTARRSFHAASDAGDLRRAVHERNPADAPGRAGARLSGFALDGGEVRRGHSLDGGRAVV